MCYSIYSIVSYVSYRVNFQFLVIEIHEQYESVVNNRYYLSFSSFKQIETNEVFLFGIVLGLIPIILAGLLARLFVYAYLQYKHSDQLDI